MAQQYPVVVLGSTGKLGRMLRYHWARGTGVVWQARHAVTEHDTAWLPGADWPGPARASAIVALWGVVPGRGDLSDNTRLALAATELARQLGADRVLHCSSAAVYAPGPHPRRESEAAPMSDYGRAKLAMERVLASGGDDIANCCMRIGNVAGADSLFASLDRGGPVTLDRFQDGLGPRRSYLGPRALAHVIQSLLVAPLADIPAVVNVAGDGAVDMADLVRAAQRPLIWRVAPEGAMAQLALDISRLKVLCNPGPSDPDALISEWRQMAGRKK